MVLETTTPQWPLLVYIFAVLGLVAIMIGLSYLLGQRHKERATGEYYEAGILHTGNSQIRFTAHFYLIAIFFIIFDLEVVFIVAWAIGFKRVGWAGLWGVFIFILILLIVLVYEWRIGALNFAADGKQIIKRMKSKKKGETK